MNCTTAQFALVNSSYVFGLFEERREGPAEEDLDERHDQAHDELHERRALAQDVTMTKTKRTRLSRRQ